MARKSVEFGIIVHEPKDFNPRKMQKAFDDFYVAQVKNTLDNSGLDKSHKAEIIGRLVAGRAGKQKNMSDCA